MEDYRPRIGKNVIETLTLGMYENAFFIYREYVQNAADQIDVAVEDGILDKKSDGIINIAIEKQNRSIKIRDNATGIKSSEVLRFLGDVADSNKDRTVRKGFRGIGRLGGLGYCEELIFETSFQGESIKTQLSLNAKELKRIIEDKSINSDASAVISAITEVKGYGADKEDHFFEVYLKNVTNEDLLDEDKVRDYLSMVGPLPFADDFQFKDKIKESLFEMGLGIEEYDVLLNVNQKPLFKAYKMDLLDKNSKPISKVLDVNFFRLRSEEKELLALGWYGITQSLNKVIHPINIERGLRIRKSNIQIGDENTLNRFFTEDRFNHHFIGEIHVMGNNYIPNARRDYFNENKTVSSFEIEIGKQFSELTRLARITSEIHNRYNEVNAYLSEELQFQEKDIRDKSEEDHLKAKLLPIREKAIKASARLESLQIKYDPGTPEYTLLEDIIGDSNISIPSANQLSRQLQYSPLKLNKINDDQQIVVNQIISLLEKNLDFIQAEKIKKLIIDLYK